MKHNVTTLNSENEPLAFTKLMFGNYVLETPLECYTAWPALTSLDMQLGLLAQLMVMKLVQFIFLIVAVVAAITKGVVLAHQIVHVQMSYGP